MNKLFRILFLALLISIASPAKADFGDADFPVGMFSDGPKSYHDAWCRKLENECRVRFQGPAMWVEGQGGIQIDQLLGYRFEKEGVGGFSEPDYYNYISYISKTGQRREALFLFKNQKAHREFIKAFIRWKRQESVPIPNYRLPASQGPQETHGRDKGLNPYDNPPINDWLKKTTKELEDICKSPVYRKRPVCRSYR